MKIFLVGFMGSGKTTIGRLISQKLDFNFVDTDRHIEMQQSLTVAEIFLQHGEAVFRKMEHEMLLYLLNCDSAVIATGGGMPCYNDNMNIMLSVGKVVYLKTSPQELAKRLILSNTERPLIKGKTENELLHYITAQLSKREHYYNCADVTIQTEKNSIEDILKLVNY